MGRWAAWVLNLGPGGFILLEGPEGAEVQERWTPRGVAPLWKRWPASCLALLLPSTPSLLWT